MANPLRRFKKWITREPEPVRDRRPRPRPDKPRPDKPKPPVGTPPPGTVPSNPDSPAAVQTFVQCLRAQKGKRYVWATAGPNTFDCSGLIAYCYQSATGKPMTRSSHEQCRLGSPVRGADIRAGDVLCYGGGAHDGGAISPTRAIHALNEQAGVIEADIPGNMGLRFDGARRIFAGGREAGAGRVVSLHGLSDAEFERALADSMREQGLGPDTSLIRAGDHAYAKLLHSSPDGPNAVIRGVGFMRLEPSADMEPWSAAVVAK